MTDPIVYLTEADVRRLLDPQALRTALSAAFVSYSTGDASVPARIAAHSEHGLLAAMPGYVAGVVYVFHQTKTLGYLDNLRRDKIALLA